MKKYMYINKKRNDCFSLKYISTGTIIFFSQYNISLFCMFISTSTNFYHIYMCVCKHTHIAVFLSLSLVWLFQSPWTVAHQASLSFTISLSLLKLMSIELVMQSSHHILCPCLLLLPSIFPSMGAFSMNWLFASGGQSIGASTSDQSFQWIFRADFL